MIFNKKKNTTAINEFNQEIAGNSLTKDAWRRLRKNKMAVISLVVVIIYILLAVLAPILPIYPYDEIILDHQHLPPSFTKNAGELLMEKRLADLYTQAWRQGNLELTEEEDDMLWEWIDSNEVNKVWDYMYEKGNAMVAEGSYTLSSYEQRRIDSLEEDIRTELQITLKDVWYRADSGSERVKLTSLDTDEILAAYAQLVNISAEDQKTQYMKEIEQQVLREIKERTPDLSDEEYEILLNQEFNDMSESRLNTLIRSNVLVKLNNAIRSVGLRNLKDAAEDGTMEFPLEEEISISETISATIKASKVHERQYYLGTDYQGRDMLSRIIYGGQVSIAIGFVGTITSVLIGIILGALAGYLGGKVDYIIMRIVDIMYGLPYMLLVIIAMAIFGRNILNLFFALAIISWLTVSRMVRGQIMSLKNQEFIEAARSMGAPTRRIIFKHLVPNSLSVIIVFSTLRIPSFIMTESFLSFLGLGVQAPFASWGSLVGDGVTGMTLYPWKLFFPALVMTIFLFAMNFLGDGLRDAFDPQSKNQL